MVSIVKDVQNILQQQENKILLTRWCVKCEITIFWVILRWQNVEELSEKAPDPLSSWMERGEMVRKRLEKITHGSASEFVNTLCQQFLRDHDDNRIQTFSTRLGELRKMVYMYQHEVLQIDGFGENYQILESLVQDIRTLMEWLDELLVFALLDITEVQRLFDASGLLYQKH